MNYITFKGINQVKIEYLIIAIDNSSITRYNWNIEGGDNMKLTLKQYRLLKEMTQEKLADLAGIHVQTYRKLEKHPEKATIEQALKISEALGESYDDIFFGTDSSLNRESCGSIA